MRSDLRRTGSYIRLNKKTTLRQVKLVQSGKYIFKLNG